MRDSIIEDLAHGSLFKDLTKEVRCETHVDLSGGTIDILTLDELIVVSHWDDWRESVSVLNKCEQIYPYRRKRIHLFGDPPGDSEGILRTIGRYFIHATEDTCYSPPRSPRERAENTFQKYGLLSPIYKRTKPLTIRRL
jgi:hypothetical protein